MEVEHAMESIVIWMSREKLYKRAEKFKKNNALLRSNLDKKKKVLLWKLIASVVAMTLSVIALGASRFSIPTVTTICLVAIFFGLDFISKFDKANTNIYNKYRLIDTNPSWYMDYLRDEQLLYSIQRGHFRVSSILLPDGGSLPGEKVSLAIINLDTHFMKVIFQEESGNFSVNVNLNHIKFVDHQSPSFREQETTQKPESKDN